MKKLFRVNPFIAAILLACTTGQFIKLLAYDKHKPIISFLGAKYEIEIKESQKSARESMLTSLEGKYRGTSTRPFDIQEINILSDGTADAVIRGSSGVTASKRHIYHALEIDISIDMCEALNLTTSKYYTSLKDLKSRGYSMVFQLDNDTTFVVKGSDLVYISQNDGILGYVLKKSWWPF